MALCHIQIFENRHGEITDVYVKGDGRQTLISDRMHAKLLPLIEANKLLPYVFTPIRQISWQGVWVYDVQKHESDRFNYEEQ